MQKEKNLNKNIACPAAGSPYWVWGGRLLAGGCIFFIFLKFHVLQDRIGALYFGTVDFLWMGFLVFAWCILNCLPALTWGEFVECMGGRVPNVVELILLYAKSNLAKYLPGNIMHYVSRSILAKNYAISLQATALASLMDVLTAAMSALLFAGLALYRDIFLLAALMGVRLQTAGLIFFVALCGCFWGLKKTGLWASVLTGKGSGLKFARTLVRNVGLYCGYYLATSCIFYILLCWVAAETSYLHFFEFSVFRKTAGLYTLAWLIGFLVPGASGGIGVRETMLLVLIRDPFPQESVLISAFLLRVLSIFSEVLNYLMTEVLARRRPYSCRK